MTQVTKETTVVTHSDYRALIINTPSVVYNPGDVYRLDAYRIPLDSADMPATLRDYREFVKQVLEMVETLQYYGE